MNFVSFWDDAKTWKPHSSRWIGVISNYTTCAAVSSPKCIMFVESRPRHNGMLIAKVLLVALQKKIVYLGEIPYFMT